MTRMSIAVAVAVAAVAVTAAGGRADGPAELVIRRVAIVDAADGRVVPDRDIVVRGSRIERITASGAALPTAKITIAGTGKYAIAGLVDAGVAAAAFAPEEAQALLGWGVTGIGDNGGDDAFRARWRRELDSGRRYAPRLAPPCRGATGVAAATTPAAPDAVHDALARLVAAGRSPAAALRVFSADNARALCLDSVGNLAPGQSADLVVLTANPLDDIRHTRQIDAVVFRGDVLTQAHLRMLRRGTLPPPTPASHPGR